MFRVVAVRAPWKAIVPEVSVSVTVAASTVLPKVVPPDWVISTVPISVPTAPLTVTAPVVLMVRLEDTPPAVPVTAARLIGVAAPVPTVSVVLSAIVAVPMVIWPVEVPPTVELPPTATPVPASPRVMTPVPAAVTLPLRLMLEGAVATTPPVKFRVSPLLPRVTVPVLAKVVAPAMVLLAPVMETL